MELHLVGTATDNNNEPCKYRSYFNKAYKLGTSVQWNLCYILL